MTQQPTIGHNNPPDPIEEISAEFETQREEAANWLDGSPVESEGQMKAVDALRKDMRQWRLNLEAGQKTATAPLRAIYQAELDRWKPTIEDAKRIEACLVAAVDTFKRKLAAEKAAAERAAWEKANRAKQEAEAKARAAAASDLEAQREAEAARQAAIEAERKAQEAKKDNVKGMRKVTKYEVTDYRALLHWIVKNDRDAVTAFIDDYAQKNYKRGAQNADGLRVWDEKEAF